MEPATLTNEEIVRGLQDLLGEQQVLHRLIDVTAHAGDASIYRLVPRVVVKPRNVLDVRNILDYCRRNRLYLTWRAAGTSLSGQAVTDGVLVDVATHWKNLRILDDGKRVAVEPGVVGAHVNAFLAPYRAKIGPDPASINACMMGGIAANNASGMCCDVLGNSYHTLSSMKMMLADGYELDTADADADDRLQRDRPSLYAGLLATRDAIRRDDDMAGMIRRKFSIKNTCGYSMNAFVDFDRPVDILAHLLIGSEGTLGFISEITLNTLPEKPDKATALVYFAHFLDAHRSVKPLVDAGAVVLEIMDSAAMRSVEKDMDYGFPIEPDCAALLIEFQEDTEEELASRLEQSARILAQYELMLPAEFTRDPDLQARYWHMRKGLYPSVGAMRAMGTAVIIEDICVRPERLADCVTDLHELFAKYQFPDTIIFGHARSGNLHFVICTDFSDVEQVSRYAAMMDDLMGMVVGRYDASLKAEHGTGRNVAPFVELEWGPKLYGYMWRVKSLLDPDSILNPGVVLNRDPDIHLKNLKVMPAVSPVVDACIECGFCEPRCPSRDLTLTPRQRIVLLREMARLRALGDPGSLAKATQLREDYAYHGINTCAADGMCATACPVKIDTGVMVKELRAEQHAAWTRGLAVAGARHYGLAAWAARTGLALLRLTDPLGIALARPVANLVNRLSRGQVPGLPADMPVPGPAPRLQRSGTSRPTGASREIVYFPSCLTRIMGALPGEDAPVGVAEAVTRVLAACGWDARIPDGASKVCCGQPFASKGFVEAAAESARGVVELLWDATRGGELSIVCDTSPCTGQILSYNKVLSGNHRERWLKLMIRDFPTFMAREVLPTRTDWPKLARRVVLHPTCTLVKIGAADDLRRVAETFAESVVVPVMAECCGFAGDRGFLFPELTRSATRAEAQEAVQGDAGTTGEGRDTRYYSTCRTCEIGMSAATHKVYQSVVYLCYDALARAEKSG
jgi:D-lactate dehydrogenase